jgi:hypothetical protein
MKQIAAGQVYRHQSGGIYTVFDVTNTSHPSDKFVPTVYYIGAHGQRWSRPLVEFQDKFTLMFYGTNLAPISVSALRIWKGGVESRHNITAPLPVPKTFGRIN